MIDRLSNRQIVAWSLATAGLALIGYLGYRVVKYLFDQCCTTRKTKKVWDNTQKENETGSTPVNMLAKGLVNFPEFESNVEWVNLTGNKIGAIPDDLSTRYRKLKTLALARNSITDIPVNLFILAKRCHIILNENPLSISALKKIRENLIGIRFDDTFVNLFKEETAAKLYEHNHAERLLTFIRRFKTFESLTDEQDNWVLLKKFGPFLLNNELGWKILEEVTGSCDFDQLKTSFKDIKNLLEGKGNQPLDKEFIESYAMPLSSRLIHHLIEKDPLFKEISSIIQRSQEHAADTHDENGLEEIYKKNKKTNWSPHYIVIQIRTGKVRYSDYIYKDKHYD
jgi:hypothetical protein